jgi:hypothetical protein
MPEAHLLRKPFAQHELAARVRLTLALGTPDRVARPA